MHSLQPAHGVQLVPHEGGAARDESKKNAQLLSIGCGAIKVQQERHRLRIKNRPGFFAKEHPLGASSWDMDCVKEVAQDAEEVIFDQCMLGLMTRSSDGKWEHAQKQV